ncbi:VOC family protein [Corynebacterium epidermidicanis]|uniref:Lactoylglutathione lyase family protein n=1 Tax=Corynebacterium epidermidicanis TaxID=1050174 RepID=A0A0G3GLG5_9CORY|nr:VOC family protein [Corynebacterium epidermidicanis]AKK02076.1 lactoylglutathione lyase family protein [Corynebacterium epidermidicanis]
MPAFSAHHGMPIWIELSTSDLRKSSHFYREILGWDIDDTDSYRIVRAQGLPVAGLVEQVDSTMPDTWVTYFYTENLDETALAVSELGGRVLAEPTDVTRGRVALCVDTAGALFGLMETDETFVSGGEPGTAVWHELTATTHYAEVGEFYRQLFGWVTTDTDADDFRYTTALEEGAAFAGIWDAQAQFPPHIPSFWQTYLGVKSADEAAALVPELGGEIMRQPWDSEFGRMVIVADSTGATITLAETPEPVAEGREEDPLEGIDLSQFQ